MEVAARTEQEARRRGWYSGPRTAPHIDLRVTGTRCSRCGMGFRDTAPPSTRVRRSGTTDAQQPGEVSAGAGTDDDAGDVEILRCPNCGRRFWADPQGAGGRCTVGLLPPSEDRQ